MQLQYKRNLIKQQQQAYEGAKMFYYGFLPLSFLGLLFFTSYLYQFQSTQSNYGSDYNELPFISLVTYIVLSILTYTVAAYYYTKCNKIQTYPANNKKSLLNQVEIQMNSSENFQKQTIISQFEQDTSQLAHNNSIKNKPQKHFCTFCNKQCQYRTKHCRKCQTCIQKYDHHCFWIGNCVGKHNHRAFYIFLLIQSTNNLLQLKAFLFLKQIAYNSGIDMHIILWLIIYSCILVCFGFVCFTGWLAIYHTMLITFASTTWQQMRRDKINYLKYLPTGYNPFSKGWKQNFIKFFTEQIRENTQNCQLQIWQSYILTYEQAKTIKPGFNLIENQYYSCC